MVTAARERFAEVVCAHNCCVSVLRVERRRPRAEAGSLALPDRSRSIGRISGGYEPDQVHAYASDDRLTAEVRSGASRQSRTAVR